MLTDVTIKLDEQHMECSSFFKSQCSMIETALEDTSEVNSEAADWCSEVLLAQREINVREINIPRITEASGQRWLQVHRLYCPCSFHSVGASWHSRLTCSKLFF